MDQHELQSALLSAMYTFSRESFKESRMEQIVFNDIKISLYAEESSEIIMALIHDRNFKDKKIKNQLDKAWKRFHEKYNDAIKSSVVNVSVFNGFRDDLKELGITPGAGIKSIAEAQQLKDEYRTKYPNIFGWIKNRFV